jgi:hypothetical protein
MHEDLGKSHRFIISRQIATKRRWLSEFIPTWHPSSSWSYQPQSINLRTYHSALDLKSHLRRGAPNSLPIAEDPDTETPHTKKNISSEGSPVSLHLPFPLPINDNVPRILVTPCVRTPSNMYCICEPLLLYCLLKSRN